LAEGRPLAVVVGSIGKLPLAGHSVFVLHHLVGLRELGYELYYAERQNRPEEVYDPAAGGMTDDPAYALRYLPGVLARAGIGEGAWSFLDLAGRCHGAGRRALVRALEGADFVLTVADPTWFDELERCPRRAYIDGDPLFTQVAMETGSGSRADPPAHYGALFTYGVRIGQAGCTIPSGGREWLPARPVVATALWRPAPPPPAAPVAALLHWAAGGELRWDGRTYGHKDREFMQFAGLPRRLPETRFVLAAGGGKVPADELHAEGWELESALRSSRSIEAYRDFILGSLADFGVAKHAYVASRGGWFSDRSTSFLASGRPVLHQETGFSEWLPTGEGVLAFDDLESAAAAVEEIQRDYVRHSRAARALAEEHFEARSVLGSMLEAAGFR
jgi:hypothetical protein